MRPYFWMELGWYDEMNGHFWYGKSMDVAVAAPQIRKAQKGRAASVGTLLDGTRPRVLQEWFHPDRI